MVQAATFLDQSDAVSAGRTSAGLCQLVDACQVTSQPPSSLFVVAARRKGRG